MKKIVFLFVTGIVTGQLMAQPVQTTTSTADKPWQQVSVNTIKAKSSIVYDAVIDPATTFQTVEGFGACFNELSWDALNLLDKATQDEIVREFFTPEGFNFTICRMPLGANDYSRDWYSLNDSAGDLAMNHFSIERDRQTLIPYIKAALAFRPDLKVWASPWCPPAWMKTNNHYACRPDSRVNDLSAEGAGKEGTDQFIMQPEYLSAYALYFSKFIKAYQAEGIPLYAVHVQNEFNSCQNFPSCIWSYESLALFIGQYLGPHFEKEQVQAQIWLGTIERPSVDKAALILNDPLASKYIKGAGFQWAGKGAIEGIHTQFPDLKLMQTESECGNGSNDQAAAEHTWGLMKHYLRRGAGAYLYWNMILTEGGISRWGWKQNSLMTVNSQTKEVARHPEFYLFKHLTHFVLPGAVRIQTLGYDELLAFKNPDGKIILILANPTNENKQIALRNGRKAAQINMPPHSFSTVVW